MKAVILLAGPSLSRLKFIPTADVSIAVKRAVLKFPQADWAVVLDKPALRSIRIPDWCKLLSRRHCWPKYIDRPGTAVEDLGCPALIADPFGSTAALALAGHLGATSVEAYGADFGQGEHEGEFDGHQPGERTYTPGRWRLELEHWNAVSDWLKGRGCEVKRNGTN